MNRAWLMSKLRGAVRYKHEERRRAYQAVFLGPDGKPSPAQELVLADFRKFCNATDSSFIPGDPHATAFGEGKREVWCRIQGNLFLSDEMISALVEQAYPEEMENGNED